MVQFSAAFWEDVLYEFHLLNCGPTTKMLVLSSKTLSFGDGFEICAPHIITFHDIA
jgi:hypothetical protein